MASDDPLYREDEYVLLTQKYQDIPAGSVGRISMIYTRHLACYRVDFGPSLRRGPIAENLLIALSTRRDRKRT